MLSNGHLHVPAEFAAILSSFQTHTTDSFVSINPMPPTASTTCWWGILIVLRQSCVNLHAPNSGFNLHAVSLHCENILCEPNSGTGAFWSKKYTIIPCVDWPSFFLQHCLFTAIDPPHMYSPHLWCQLPPLGVSDRSPLLWWWKRSAHCLQS